MFGCKSGWWGLMLALGCAGQTQAPAASPKPAREVEGTTRTGAEPAVARPKDWLAVGRVKGYTAWRSAGGVPPALQWVQDELAKENPILADIDVSQAIEFALVFDWTWRPPPKPQVEQEPSAEPGTSAEPEPNAATKSEDDPFDHLLAAVSIPLSSFDEARYVALGFTKGRDGTLSDSECVVSTARGPAKARLVCAEQVAVAQRLTPYLTRGLPIEPLSPAPMYAELSVEPLRSWWLGARTELRQKLEPLKLLGPTAAVGYEIVHALFDETDAWIQSAQGLRFETRFLDNGDLSSRVHAHFDDPQPWLVEGYLATASSIPGPPESFLNLPADARSVGYDYGLPSARAARIQARILELAKAAQQEYGPVSKNLPGNYSRAESKAIDGTVDALLAALASPCLTTPQVSWASGAQGLPEDGAALPIDELAPRFFGYVLYSTPSTAQCPAFVNKLVDTTLAIYRSLPKATRDELPLQVSKRQARNFPGLPKAEVQRVTVPRKFLDSAFVTGELATKLHWAPPRGPVSYSLITVPNADGRGNDWMAAGFDEAELARLLRTAIGQGGKTLRQRPELAVLSETRPLQFSERTYSDLDTLSALGATGPWQELAQLLRGTRFTSTLTLKRGPAGSDVELAYVLPKANVDSLSKILDWDKQRLDALSATSTGPAETLSGPVGIVREIGAGDTPKTPAP
jgi:hypothetical protein